MIQGNWWIPGNEEKMLPGVLSFANNEIHLELLGDSLEQQPDGPVMLSRAREIHGVIFGGREANDTEKSLVGKRIILQNCSEINRNFLRRVTASTFSAAVAYAVQNSQDAKDLSLKFHEIRVGFSHLPDFAITEGRLVRHDWRHGEDKGIEGLTASFNYQTLPTAKINGKTLEFWQSVGYSGDGKRRSVIKPSISFKIRSEEAMSLQEWDAEFIVPLQHFLTLATTQLNRVTSLEAFHNDNVETIELSPRDKRIQTIPFNIITKETLQFGNIDFPEALFRLFDLRDIEIFEKVMVGWFQLYDDHGTRMVQSLLFASLSNFNIGDRFLNLARALEVYYRAKYSDEEMRAEEFRARRKRILEQVDEVYREWLKGKLTENTTNKQTLNQQFQSLIQSLTELELAEALSVSGESIAKRVKDIRNNLTHVGRKSKDIRSEEIFWLSYLMEYLLKALLLREIGFPAEQVKKDRQYSFRMERIAKALSHLQSSES